jgi:hypothetical protein
VFNPTFTDWVQNGPVGFENKHTARKKQYIYAE